MGELTKLMTAAVAFIDIVGTYGGTFGAESRKRAAQKRQEIQEADFKAKQVSAFVSTVDLSTICQITISALHGWRAPPARLFGLFERLILRHHTRVFTMHILTGIQAFTSSQHCYVCRSLQRKHRSRLCRVSCIHAGGAG